MLQGKTIIVTGGASGIGREAVMMFAADGAKVVLADWSEDAGRDYAREVDEDAGVKKADGACAFIRTDVSLEADVARMVEFAVQRFGRLDGAYNNAGVGPSRKLLPEMTSEEFDAGISVNFRGMFLSLKYEIAAMRGTEGGAIVNCASIGGERAIPMGTDYISGKHGVVGLTRAASSEARYTGVRVNAVLPGRIVTPLTERVTTTPEFLRFSEANGLVERHSIGRFGQPVDVARAVKWLLSDEAEFINGAMMPVDGGYLAR